MYFQILVGIFIVSLYHCSVLSPGFQQYVMHVEIFIDIFKLSKNLVGVAEVCLSGQLIRLVW